MRDGDEVMDMFGCWFIGLMFELLPKAAKGLGNGEV
jgi:hypothetical protein